jgi:hypothetical protein
MHPDIFGWVRFIAVEPINLLIKNVVTNYINFMLVCITLFKATTKGVLRLRSKLRDSIVCGSNPCIISTTRMAMSHKEVPLERMFLQNCELIQ